MKKLAATLITICLFTFGCDKCPPSKNYFDIEGVHLQSDFNTMARTRPDFGSIYSKDSVKFEYFTLHVFYNLRYYSLNQPKTFSFIPSAYALDCPINGEGGTEEKIESLTLVALSDYNTNYKAGDTLNNIMNVNGLPVSKFNKTKDQFDIDQLGFLIDLTEKPDTTIKHSFKLIYKLQNGETYEAASEPIKIL